MIFLPQSSGALGLQACTTNLAPAWVLEMSGCLFPDCFLCSPLDDFSNQLLTALISLVLSVHPRAVHVSVGARIIAAVPGWTLLTVTMPCAVPILREKQPLGCDITSIEMGTVFKSCCGLNVFPKLEASSPNSHVDDIWRQGLCR